ncbi:hypothetical protein AWB78_08495 [Caballeronia calidae]|uniref:Uncharacterized protein n=1 Tax=Caballeronia calidae TaxID=1777139 RepID=A0A158EK60_9BURK|nr:hypothetical protein [Caballeronia calidae]SAL07248.1 hypothetical protein AWB78_08495 [Caballeronia calidae]
MTAQEILELIKRDARLFHLSGRDALPAFAEILAEHARQLRSSDLTTLIAIGTVIYRDACVCYEVDDLIARLRSTSGS